MRSVALIISVLLLFSVGILMVFNVTSAEVMESSVNASTYVALIKQLVYFFIGILLGLFTYFVGYREIIRLSPIFLFITTVLLLLVFVPKIGISINGARRWIGFEGYSFQPSEFAKYLIPVYCINYLSFGSLNKSFPHFLKFLSVFIIPIAIILLEPDNGTTAIILISLVALFFLARIRPLFWALPLFLTVLVGAAVAYQMPHVPGRIKVYLHPESDIKGRGHQPYQAKIAAGSGGLVGRGIGESIQKLNYLPQARSDYIAAIYAEELGFLGILVLISIYLIITYLGFYIAANASDREGFYLAAMMTFLISFQAFLNLAIVSGMLPSKGTTLPFFSQGGTSLIVNTIAVFLILSVASSRPRERVR